MFVSRNRGESLGLKLPLLFMFCLFAFCSLEPIVHDQETIGDYFAYCALKLDQKQKVLVGRTVPESLPRYYSDAVVTISGGGGIANFVHIKDGVYEEVPPLLPIAGDSVYTLSVKFPDGHLIRAQAKVPGDFEILEPQPGDTLYYQIGSRQNYMENMILPSVSWTASNGAFYYTAVAEIEFNGVCGGQVVNTNYTEIYIPYYPYSCTNPLPSTEYNEQVHLIVTAIDSSRNFIPNYREHLVPDSLDYDTVLQHDWAFEDGILQHDFYGGKGFFTAFNQATRDFVLHVKIVENGGGGE